MSKHSDISARSALNLTFFAGLPESEASSLMAAATVRHYAKGEVIARDGSPADRFFVVQDGWIKLLRYTGEGEEALAGLLATGDIFGEMAVLGEAPYPFTAAAAEASTVIEIPADVIRRQAQTSPELFRRIVAAMAREMHKLQMENEHMALMSAPQRVGCLLLQLSAGMIGKGGTLPFPYDKSLAAQRLGMSPETFSRALAQLKPVGVTVKGAEITIDSFTGLMDFCCGHCSASPGHCRGAGSCHVTSCGSKKEDC